MIITRTPFRISLFGGGTDYPGWYRVHGGAVLSTTIDKYCYISVRNLPPFFDHRIRVVYSVNEMCNHVDEIQHPSVRECLRFLDVGEGVEIHHDGDLPARSGMGSSSAFTVGLLKALHALKGRMVSATRLTAEALHVEQALLAETVGSQDQVSAAHGGFNQILFASTGEISVSPVIMSASRLEELQSSLMLFYTGFKRTAAKIAETYVSSIDLKHRQLWLIRSMVDRAMEVLSSDRPLADLGRMMHEAWLAKRSLSDAVSSPEIDSMYSAATDAGALGGKVTGAGGGGFLLLFVPPEKRPLVRESLSRFIHVPFRFERSGSEVIFFNHEADYSEAARDNHRRAISPARELNGLENGAPRNLRTVPGISELAEIQPIPVVKP